MSDYDSEYPRDPRQQPNLNADTLMDFISPTLRRSDEYTSAYEKGLNARSPWFWLSPEGQEEKEALTAPSIMDEYIKEKDPEQWGRIKAAMEQKYLEGVGPAIGTGKIPGLKGTAAMPEVLPAIKNVPAIKPQFQKLREVIPGMYSKAEAIIENKMGGSASPQQIGAMLREAKPEEVQYLGIPEFLEGKNKVTKEDILEHIRSGLPNIQPLPVKGQLAPEIKQEISALAKQKQSVHQEEYDLIKKERELEEKNDILFQNYLDTADKNGESHLKAMGLENTSIPTIEQYHQDGAISDETFNALMNYMRNADELVSTIPQRKRIDGDLYNLQGKINQLRSLSDPTKFSSQVEPGGEHYQEHLFQINPKPGSVVQRGYRLNLTRKGAEIFDDYQRQINDLHIQASEANNRVGEEVRKLEKPLFEESVRINNELKDVTSYLDFQNYKFLEGLKDSIPFKSDLHRTHTLSEVREVLDRSRHEILFMLDALDQQEAKSIYENTLLKNPEYLENLEKSEILLLDLHRLDNNLFALKEQKEKELVQPYLDKIDALKKERDKVLAPHMQEPFLAGHWEEPDVFAHTRVNERVGSEGERHLFAEELQSDWHQAVRDKTKALKELKEQNPNDHRVEKLERELAEFPKAPMAKSWHEFLSKRLLWDAAKGDFDNLSWTTGAQQNERYNLSKKISKLVQIKSGNTHILRAYGKNGDEILAKRFEDPSELEDIIGKDLTKKLQEQESKPGGKPGLEEKVLAGQDLEIGGEGMKGFYDKIIPDYMSKLGKKYGVKPQKTTLPEAGEVWTMKLTPEMKQSILKEMFPLFTGTAALSSMYDQNEDESSEDKFSNVKSRLRK